MRASAPLSWATTVSASSRARAPALGTVAAVAALLALAACADPGQEIVGGFHGYPWGTPVDQIPEVAGSEPVGEKDGLAIHTAEVAHLGREMIAGFYFHPRTGGLVEGYYATRVELEECEREWSRIVGEVERAHPRLAGEVTVAVRPPADSVRYVSDCEYFLYRGDLEEWRATFENPGPPHDRVAVWLDQVGRSLQLTIHYQGREGRRWEERFRWPFQLPRRRPPEPPSPEPPGQTPPGADDLPFGRA